MAKINQKKIALIHVAKNRLGLSNDEYRDMLQDICGVTSASDVSNLGFERLMRFMESVGFRSKNYRLRNITRAQEYRIKEIEKNLGWDSNPRRLLGYCEKIVGRSLDSISTNEAGCLIGAMERTLRFQIKKRQNNNNLENPL